jgi:hypothetical protein
MICGEPSCAHARSRPAPCAFHDGSKPSAIGSDSSDERGDIRRPAISETILLEPAREAFEMK